MIQKRKLIHSNTPSCCPKCASASIICQTYSDTVDFRTLELDVENLERFNCQSCGQRWETPAQIQHNQVLIKDEYAKVRDRLRERYGMLTAKKIANIRKCLELNQREASSLFGGGANAFNKYESGEVLQSFAMDRLVRLAGAIGLPAVAFLKDVDGPHTLLQTSTQSMPLFVIIRNQPTGSADGSLYLEHNITKSCESRDIYFEGTGTNFDSYVALPSSGQSSTREMQIH